MARRSNVHDATLVEMALIGYEAEKEKIEGRIRELRARLKGNRAASTVGDSAQGPAKRVMSDAARERIAAAQRKRWAEQRKRQAAAKE